MTFTEILDIAEAPPFLPFELTREPFLTFR